MSDFINYSLYREAEDLKRLQFISSFINNIGNRSLHILDFGCGDGNISFQLAHEGYHVTAIDLSKEAIQQDRILHSHPNVTYECKSIEEFSMEEHFDIVVCSEVLEHTINPLSVLRSLVSILFKNGFFIITIPNGFGPREMFVTKPVQRMMRDKQSYSYKVITTIKRVLGFNGQSVHSSAHNLEHIQFFRLSDICNYAAKLNLSVVYMGASNFLEKVFPFSLLAKRCNAIQKWDCKIADSIPLSWASGFYFALKKI
ncbi:MAG: class I SAM-dependent methyltransferase [Bacteroidales bacterium]